SRRTRATIAVRREPELLKGTLQLGQSLLACGETELGRQFVDRAKRMQQIVNVAVQMGERRNWRRATILIDDLEATGRLWEAWAWCALQAEALPHETEVVGRLARLARRLSPDLPRTDPQAVPGSDFDWSQWDVPRWSEFSVGPVPAASAATSSRIRFV